MELGLALLKSMYQAITRKETSKRNLKAMTSEAVGKSEECSAEAQGSKD